MFAGLHLALLLFGCVYSTFCTSNGRFEFWRMSAQHLCGLALTAAIPTNRKLQRQGFPPIRIEEAIGHTEDNMLRPHQHGLKTSHDEVRSFASSRRKNRARWLFSVWLKFSNGLLLSIICARCHFDWTICFKPKFVGIEFLVHHGIKNLAFLSS